MFYLFFYYICAQIKTFEYNRFKPNKSCSCSKKRIGKWLAEQLGKSNCTVSKWCSNSAQPDFHTLEQIAQILEVEKRELLTSSELK